MKPYRDKPNHNNGGYEEPDRSKRTEIEPNAMRLRRDTRGVCGLMMGHANGTLLRSLDAEIHSDAEGGIYQASAKKERKQTEAGCSTLKVHWTWKRSPWTTEAC